MKIAISTVGDKLSSLIDQRFGRCEYFLIVDIKNNEINKVTSVKNEGAIQGHGAGIRAAQQVGELGVNVVITGSLGPNATNVLSQVEIKAYHGSGNAEDVIGEFIAGKLNLISEVAQAHSGSVAGDVNSEERIFFPLLENNGFDSEISDHFGHAPFFGLYDTKTDKLKITKNELSHTDPDKSPVDQIIDAVNPTIVFALGIGGRAVQLFNEKGVVLKTGDYGTVQEVIDNLDKLEIQNKDCGHKH
ncbi:hypothetical protein HOK51_01975 [Candidatus Woesearchaeota archaeon]|jgi:predicted Fe-Mo cluster-binding NifX family protein|nr:hypothetical protein [Candidatus Woesearchaeota archaeon]MBT6518583.1 hypothetical protein [Candidatus Woesearchaeota archaeon]MBT7367448.1 hypothetical protein [Candidatus Woesearchaeota archaeon]